MLTLSHGAIRGCRRQWRVIGNHSTRLLREVCELHGCNSVE